MMQLALGHPLSRSCNEYERHEMRRICRILKRFKGIVISDPLFCTQYDQIGRFIALWATFQSLCNNYFSQIALFLTILVKVSKSFIFIFKSFWVNFYRHLATFYWSRCCCCLTSALGHDGPNSPRRGGE